MSAAPILANPVLLLQTKLYRPHPYADHLTRPHLIQHLNQGLRRKLTLVAAPAGYGKTTAVTQWLDTLPTQSHQIAWLSLDESDNDLILFVHYLVAAVQKQHPNHCTSTLAALHNPMPPSWAQLVTLLLNDLVALPTPLILVLDDYHFVTHEEIHQFLDRLLAHLPPSIHLVLTTRTEPPLSLPRLRVRRQMNELRTADLSFSNAETEHYFTQGSSNSLTSTTLAALQERSQGWIAGLYLAKLSLGHSTDEPALLKQLQANNVHIMDYLITEVLAQQTERIQIFLLQTSILRRFCPPLCEALLADAFAANDPLYIDNQQLIPSIIDQLARHHLFVVSLDDSGGWYRYHHLFQLMLTRRLQKQFSPDQINALHQQASVWYAAEGMIDEALHHALAAADTQFAAQLIEQYRLQLLNQFDYYTLERWLSQIPKAVIDSRPHLLLLEFWLAHKNLQGKEDFAFQYAQQLEPYLITSNATPSEADRIILQAEVSAIRCTGHFWRNEFQQTLDCFQQAIKNLPISHLRIRSQIILYATFALQAQGHKRKAIHLMETELQPQMTEFNLPLIWSRAYMAPLYHMLGDLPRAIQELQVTINLLKVDAKHHPYIMAMPQRWLGFIHYEWNDLKTARKYFSRVDQAHPVPYYCSQLNLAWLYEIEGQTEAAEEVITELHAWALPQKSARILNEIASLRAHRLYWQGEIKQALQALREVEIDTFAEPYLPEVPAFTLVQVLIAHKQKSKWQEAEDLLEKLGARVLERGQNIRSQIHILALRALLQQRQAQPDKALDTLEQAIILAKPGGFLRTFVDLGTPIATLLYQLLERGVEHDYLGKILAAFPQTKPKSVPVQQPHQQAQKQLIEPLTKREFDVLLLLSQELSNKKIAQQLSISPLTVKRHTINIYQKLAVSNRHDAVHSAKALGIVPP